MFDTFASRYGWTIDEFGDLTPRQIHGLSRTIDRQKVVALFYDSLSYKLALAAKPPTLDELLALTSKESGEEKSVFDPETDKKLDGYMDNLVKKRREEWRKNNGG